MKLPNPFIGDLFMRTKNVLLACLLMTSGCDSFKEIDFQTERCKVPPPGNIKPIKIDSHGINDLRWDFELTDVGNTVETEPYRVQWIIEEKSFIAHRISYQFDQRGEQKVRVVITNQCFMQTVKDTTINVD